MKIETGGLSFKNAIQKRLFDILLSSIGLVLLWPLIAVCALIARVDTGLSGFFFQRRVGRDGKLFQVVKIRTMRRASKEKEVHITALNDARISKFGGLLRRYKLDELPQLYNVLVGHMSFVGPRPDLPGYADLLVGKDRLILTLRPGITGPASIKYRNEEQLLADADDVVHFNDTVLYPDKVRVNLKYLDDWSLRNDIFYLLVTLRVIRPQSVSQE